MFSLLYLLYHTRATKARSFFWDLFPIRRSRLCGISTSYRYILYHTGKRIATCFLLEFMPGYGNRISKSWHHNVILRTKAQDLPYIGAAGKAPRFFQLCELLDTHPKYGYYRSCWMLTQNMGIMGAVGCASIFWILWELLGAVENFGSCRSC